MEDRTLTAIREQPNMAHQEKLTRWILQNAARFDLRVQELSWIKSVFPGWHDLQISISAFGQTFIGRGSDPDSNTALGKAVCEAVERSLCFRYGISSLGVAGHLSLDLAQENARLELIERASFAHQIAARIALKPLPRSIDFPFQKYKDQGVNMGLFNLVAPNGFSVICCLAEGTQAQPLFGGILGLGAAMDVRAATEKAVLECLRSTEYQLHAKLPSITEGEFRKIENPTSQNRQALLREPIYFQLLLTSMRGHPLSDFTIPEGKFERLDLDSIFGDCPLVFARYATRTPIVQPEFLA